MRVGHSFACAFPTSVAVWSSPVVIDAVRTRTETSTPAAAELPLGSCTRRHRLALGVRACGRCRSTRGSGHAGSSICFPAMVDVAWLFVEIRRGRHFDDFNACSAVPRCSSVPLLALRSVAS
jgi:hypothetical protein